jgi:hypothetical protein
MLVILEDHGETEGLPARRRLVDFHRDRIGRR